MLIRSTCVEFVHQLVHSLLISAPIFSACLCFVTFVTSGLMLSTKICDINKRHKLSVCVEGVRSDVNTVFESKWLAEELRLG